MISFNKIKNMPLQQLLIYKDALEALRAKYEQDLVPLYGMVSKPGMQTQQQKEWTVKLTKVKGYLSTVYQAIEDIVFKELEEQETYSNANKELLVENKEKKTNKNVKKNSKKN